MKSKITMNKKAMTLVEIMIVIAILGLLVALGVPGYVRSRDRARRDTCANNLRMIENAADQYRIDNNLSIATDVDITSLWPASASAKSVSSYINKQLFCPVAGNTYVGDGQGASSGTSSGSADNSDTAIEANGVPYCVVSGTSNIYEDGNEFAHTIQ